MTKGIGKNFPIVIWDEEFERRDKSFEKWFTVQVEKKTMDWTGNVSYVRPFRVQKVLNHNLHLN